LTLSLLIAEKINCVNWYQVLIILFGCATRNHVHTYFSKKEPNGTWYLFAQCVLYIIKFYFMQKGTKCHLEPYYTEKHKIPMIFHCNKVTSGNKSVKFLSLMVKTSKKMIMKMFLKGKQRF